MSHDAAEVQKHIKTYVSVFIALMFLTIVTVAISYLHLPTVAAIIVALVVASIKGTLVASYFMHLISEKKAILYSLLLTAFFFIFLLLVPAITNHDAFRTTF